ncbi:leucine rich repeat protein [Ichthyophthirius multifiliis]|uniref:Leucine rich repeat protein n=1 Tax=Ichthyophthirius multifiliis TaxID=5932 RepID=G0QUK6_ICHMU|nr:leucine rich repeat protein [Ichthyophthirius multifiliis]EGR31090.1 leucine rich repeat protein [Ichthyophthirius multifiliis]|eukprot:XP_004034576.1 leucine rich repeat protein [Ichthyophthirius multifiliis]
MLKGSLNIQLPKIIKFHLNSPKNIQKGSLSPKQQKKKSHNPIESPLNQTQNIQISPKDKSHFSILNETSENPLKIYHIKNQIRSISPQLRKVSPQKLQQFKNLQFLNILDIKEENEDDNKSLFYIKKLYIKDKKKCQKAYEKYEKVYKNIERQSDLYELIQKQKNLVKYYKENKFLEILKEENNQNLLPKKLGFTQNTEQTQINISHYKIGEKYGRVISAGLKQQVNNIIKQIKLKDNRLNYISLEFLIESLNKGIEEIDFSQNILQIKNLQSLFFKLSYQQINLIILKLQKCSINDNSLEFFIQDFLQVQSLEIIDLSDNLFKNVQGGIFMQKIIRNLENLKELYIRGNQFDAESGLVIFQGFQKVGLVIKVFDISQNSLGHGNQIYKQKLISNIQQMIQLNSDQSLLHIDLRQNYFQKEDLFQIGTFLNQNNNIFGFHISNGFDCYMDSLQQLNFLEENNIQQNLFQYIPINSIKIINNIYYNKKKRDLHEQINLQYGDNCWICEGWIQYNFTWKGELSGILPQNTQTLYLHLEIDYFKPSLMLKELKNEHFSIKRMVPPLQQIKYYFSSDQKNSIFIQKDAQTLIFEEKNIKYNILSTNKSQKSFINEKYQVDLNIRPRCLLSQIRKNNILNKNIEEFDMEKMIFKYFDFDSEIHLKKCFEFDWEQSKIEFLIKDQDSLSKIRSLFEKNYIFINNSFNFYSIIDHQGLFQFLSFENFCEFLHFGKIIDEKYLKRVDVLNFFNTFSNNSIIRKKLFQQQHITQEKGIIRFQFLNIIIKLAKEKYIQNGLHQLIESAVQQLFNDGFLFCLKKNKLQNEWREEILFNEQMDITFKYYFNIFKIIYKVLLLIFFIFIINYFYFYFQEICRVFIKIKLFQSNQKFEFVRVQKFYYLSRNYR